MIETESRQDVVDGEQPRLRSYGTVLDLCTFLVLGRQRVASRFDLDNSRNGLVP